MSLELEHGDQGLSIAGLEHDLPNTLIYHSVRAAGIAVIGLVVGLALPEISSLALSITLVSAYILLVVGTTVVEQYRRFRVVIADRQSQRQKWTREGELLCAASTHAEGILKEITYQYSAVNCPPLKWDSSWIYKQKWAILQSICEVLRQDQRKYLGPSDYFKATVFTVVSKDVLELDCSFYPPGVEPRSTRMERKEPRYTAFRCLDSQSMEVIEDVQAELRKGRDARWVEVWPGQASLYGSMVCMPIINGERAKNSLAVHAILTVDTNRVGYFSNAQENKNFLAILLGPFRAELSLLYLTTP